MIATPQPQRMTVDAYLTWEPAQECRYEYANGEVLAMTGGTLPHNDIALNLYTLLRPQLKQKGCRGNLSKFIKMSSWVHRNFRIWVCRY